MALDLDAFAVLRAVGGHGALFKDVKIDATKAARALVVKQIKVQDTGLSELQALRRALGEETLGLVIDGMKDTEVKTMTSRLDKYHPELKASNASWRRKHLLTLASGAVDPSPKPVAVKKPKAAAKPKKKQADPLFLNDDSAGAVRKR